MKFDLILEGMSNHFTKYVNTLSYLYLGMRVEIFFYFIEMRKIRIK